MYRFLGNINTIKWIGKLIKCKNNDFCTKNVRYYRKINSSTTKVEKIKKSPIYPKIYTKFRPDLVSHSLTSIKTKKSKDNVFVNRAEVKKIPESNTNSGNNNLINHRQDLNLSKNNLEENTKPDDAVKTSNSTCVIEDNLLVNTSPSMTSVSNLMLSKKFAFKPETRSDIPPEVDIDKFLPLVENDRPVILEKPVMDKPKVDIKSLKSFKLTDEINSLRLNPLKDVKKVKLKQNEIRTEPSGLFSKVKSLSHTQPPTNLPEKIAEIKVPKNEIPMSLTQRFLMEKNSKKTRKIHSPSKQNLKPPTLKYDDKKVEVKDVVPVETKQTNLMVPKRTKNVEKLEAKITGVIPTLRTNQVDLPEKTYSALDFENKEKIQTQIDEFFKQSEAMAISLVDQLTEANDVMKELEKDFSMENMLSNNIKQEQEEVEDVVMLKDKEIDIIPHKTNLRDAKVTEVPLKNIQCECSNDSKPIQNSKTLIKSINSHPLLIRHKK